jgi:hypothetical protein
VVDVREQKNKATNKNELIPILHELSQLAYEKAGMFNSTTGAVSNEFVTGENGRAKGSFKNANGYDTMFHNHPDLNTAVPSIADLDDFVKNFQTFKKQLIIAGKEIFSFDFSQLSAEQLKNMVDTAKDRIKNEKYNKTYVRDVNQYRKDNSGKYEEEELNKRAYNEAANKWQQRIIQDVFANTPGLMSIHNIDDFMKGSKADSSGVDYDKGIKATIDTTELKNILESTTFKVQDVSEKEPTSSAIDQESINSLVGAIKTGLTPQNDGTKDSGPWAREETLRNITGSTLGKIANKIPKVDTKGLARNDILNRVAQAAEAINKKISGKISGNVSGRLRRSNLSCLMQKFSLVFQSYKQNTLNLTRLDN